MKKRLITYILSFVAFAALIAVDQWTKYLAVTYLKDTEGISIIKNVLSLTYVQNVGAAWGMLGGKQLFFIVLTWVMLVVMVYVIARIPFGARKYTALRCVMVAMAAGAAGNLIDRMVNNYVHDFIYFEIINFPVFNFADICVSLSMVALIIMVLFVFKKDDDFKFLFPKKTEKSKKEDELEQQ